MRDFRDARWERDERIRRFKRAHGKIKTVEQFVKPRKNTYEEEENRSNIIVKPPVVNLVENEDINDGTRSVGSLVCEELRKEGHKGTGKKKENMVVARGMYNEGWTQTEIAKELKCNRRSVYRYLFAY